VGVGEIVGQTNHEGGGGGGGVNRNALPQVKPNDERGTDAQNELKMGGGGKGLSQIPPTLYSGL
jgi:hypothetical protein